MPNTIGKVWNAIDNTDPQKQRAEHTAHLNRKKNNVFVPQIAPSLATRNNHLWSEVSAPELA